MSGCLTTGEDWETQLRPLDGASHGPRLNGHSQASCPSIGSTGMRWSARRDATANDTSALPRQEQWLKVGAK